MLTMLAVSSLSSVAVLGGPGGHGPPKFAPFKNVYGLKIIVSIESYTCIQNYVNDTHAFSEWPKKFPPRTATESEPRTGSD